MTSVPVSKLMDFSGKVALVTGGSSGVGRGVARRFAEAGADVAITYRSHEAEARALVSELENLGVKALAFYLEQQHVNKCHAVVQETVASLGRLDILVNNAGIYPHNEALDMTEEEWDAMLDINLKGAFFCAQAAAREFVRQGNGGAIVNISSINGFSPLAGSTHYGASKGGINMVTRCLAVEWGKYGIRVNGVAPGLIDSPDLDKNVPGWREKYSSRAPVGRIGTPLDIANACLFFASPASSWISGQTLIVDGGVLLAPAY